MARIYNSYSQDVRLRVLKAAQDGDNWKAVALHNGVTEKTAYGWARAAATANEWSGAQKPRGGSPKKIKPEHIEMLCEELSTNCNLTLQEMVKMIEQRFNVVVHRETVRRALDACSYTLKRTHRDVDYRNTPANKQKRHDYVTQFYAALENQKKVFYMDETNFNLWCSRGSGWSARGQRAVQTNVASKGKNVHVIAVISSTGVAYHESRFGSFDAVACNEFVRRALARISETTPLNEVAFVVDNAPCHAKVEAVFAEQPYSSAQLLRLGPYSPMLNPIETVFSAYKSHVKRWLATQRTSIQRVPANTTITHHRTRYLEHAAGPLFLEAVTTELCARAFGHALPFHQRALNYDDMPVGS